jgi:hypothetical protein
MLLGTILFVVLLELIQQSHGVLSLLLKVFHDAFVIFLEFQLFFNKESIKTFLPLQIRFDLLVVDDGVLGSCRVIISTRFHTIKDRIDQVLEQRKHLFF